MLNNYVEEKWKSDVECKKKSKVLKVLTNVSSLTSAIYKKIVNHVFIVSHQYTYIESSYD